MESNPFLRFLKNNVFHLPRGRDVRKILFGLYKGINMEIDFNYQAQLYFGLYEAEVYPWMKKLSKGIRTAIDIGAAFGEETLYFVKKTSAKSVYAFEPVVEMCEQIKKKSVTKLL